MTAFWLVCKYKEFTNTDVSKGTIKRVTKIFTKNKTFSLS